MYGIVNQQSYTNFLYSVDQLKIWKIILGVNVELNDLFTSPFRSDNKGSCYLRQYNGLIMFTDWANTSFNKFTIAHALAHLNGISYYDAMTMIHDYHFYGRAIQVGSVICTSTTRKVKPSKGNKTFFEPFTNNGTPAFTTADVDYWSKRDVSYNELLNTNQPCYSVKHIITNGYMYNPKTYPCYALTFETSDHFKIYCPNNPKEERFPVSSATHNDYWKWTSNNTNNGCIITKSFKDGFLINKLTGLDTYSFQSENMIPDDVSFLNKYDKKIIIYDNDEAGYKGSSNLEQHLVSKGNNKVSRLYYPYTMGKDTDDVVVNGYKTFVKPFIYSALRQ